MSTIGEPFLLSSYGLSKSLPKGTGDLNRGSSYVTATFADGTKSADGYATITAQGDGVHVLDVSSIHPVVSHTLGPSTLFSSPAISRTTDGHIVTYAVPETSPDLDSDEAGRTVWMWKRDPNGVEGDLRKKHSAVMSHTVSRLYLPKEIPERLILLSHKGDVSLTDVDLAFKSTLQSRNPKQQVLLKSYFFSTKSSPFIAHWNLASNGVVVLSVFDVDGCVCFEAVAIGEDDAIERIADFKLPSDTKITQKEILGISCSDSGYLSILTRSGSWHSFLLQPSEDTSNILISVEIITLTSLSALASGSSEKRGHDISVLSLGSSFVLLAGITKTPTRELVIHIWDLQYSVLLASHSMPMPSSLSQAEKRGLRLELISGSTTQAVLGITPATSLKKGKGVDVDSSSLRSTILVIPFTVPPTSTIANAMGHASNGSGWISQDAASATLSSELDAAQETLITSMRTMVEQNRPEAASTAFFEWVGSSNASHGPPGASNGQSNDIPLGYQFVKEVLQIVLQPSKTGNIPYSSKVLQFLLEKRAVSSTILEGGLLKCLLLRNDWPSISRALECVSDLSEDEIASCLQLVVSSHRKVILPSAGDDSAMQIDPAPRSDLPSLHTFLSSVVTYKISPAPLRSAIRQHLSDADDIICILEILDRWVVEWSVMALKLLPHNATKNPKGVFVAKPIQGKRTQTPSLAKILSFLQIVLDTSFLTLLQHPPAHDLIRQISSHLELEMSRVDEMEHLRGPLEPFARAQAKALRESVEGKRDTHVDWRKRRKAAHEQAGITVGLYRLEELVI